MIDLRPAAARAGDLIAAVSDDQLALRTPCPDLRVADLVDHIGTFAVRFRESARKEVAAPLPPAPPDGSQLGDGWRDRIVADLSALAEAWRDPAAWEGTSYAGPLELPADVVGLIAIDELVVHGWDLAVATGRPFEADDADVEAAMGWVLAFDPPRDGRLFGGVVDVPEGAPPLDRLLGLTGRDPGWRP